MVGDVHLGAAVAKVLGANEDTRSGARLAKETRLRAADMVRYGQVKERIGRGEVLSSSCRDGGRRRELRKSRYWPKLELYPEPWHNFVRETIRLQVV